MTDRAPWQTLLREALAVLSLPVEPGPRQALPCRPWYNDSMKIKSLCWCFLIVTVSSISPANVRAQMVDDTGSKWRLEQDRRKEADLISCGKGLPSGCTVA